MIESGGLSAFVDHNDAAFPTAVGGTPPALKVSAPEVSPKAASVPNVPVVTPEPEPVAQEQPVPAQPVLEAPAELAPADIVAPTPPQPVVVESLVAAKETAADWQVPHALEGHHIMNEAIETGKKFAEDAKVRLQSIVGDFNEKAKVAVEKSSKTVEELTDLTKGNVEALVESSKIAAKGVEALGQNAAEYGRASFEKTSATFKSFASVKSPVEFFQLQSELVTSAFDTLAAETAKTSEALLKLAGEIAQPISNRAAIVSDKLKSLAA
ncbi:TIGR01841 family phasin [Sphingobium sufflavum]|uniref:phasin family protein n=1 Tax=Sphingobium sufflavum TaxID=1129547 RepID=UPI001F340F53|nr:phasin family protein [Sphingobium sufflavum]MCE7795503.1 TIGR01841 family phasin [Sphingobium sufflavum]